VPSAGYEPGHSPIHRLPSPLKILLTFVLAVLMLVPNGSIPFLLATLLLCAAAAVGGVFSSRWFAPLRRLVLFLAFSFAVPVVFTQTGHVYWDLGPWSLTSDGVAHGTRAVWRVVLLALGVSLLVRTTAPDELTRGLQKILAPLRVLRIDVQRTAAIVSLSWSLIPVVWERAQTCILSRRSRQSKWRDAVPALGDTIAALYCLRDDGAEIAAPDAHAACPVFAGQKERKDHP
jgi:energy-coupling factor transport system permease protein